MKKIIAILPVMALLAASCSSMPEAGVQPKLMSTDAASTPQTANTTTPTSQKITSQGGSQNNEKPDSGAVTKVYAHPKYGYSFKYPAVGLAENINQKTYANNNSESTNQDLVEFGYGKDLSTYQILTYIGAITIQHSLENWIQHEPTIDNDLTSYSKISIGGHTAYLHKDDSTAFVSDQKNVYSIEVVETNDKSSVVPNNNDPTFNQILSSFAFKK